MPSWSAYCGETGVRHSTTTSCSFCFASPPEILDLTDSPSPIPRTSQSGIQISQRFETYPRSNGDQRIGHLLPSRQRSSYQTPASYRAVIQFYLLKIETSEDEEEVTTLKEIGMILISFYLYLLI